MALNEKQLYSTVSAAMAAGNLKRAAIACRELNERFEDYFEGWGIASELHMRLGNPRSALIAIDRALRLRPDNTMALLQRTDCLIAQGRIADADAVLQPLATRIFDRADVCDRLGMLLTRLDRHELALTHYRKATEIEPNNASNHYNLAAAQRFLGDLTGAELSVNEALRLKPLDHESLAMRSSLRRQTAQDNHIAELKRALANPHLTRPGDVHVCYALAKELDDIGEPQQSFHYLKKGADLRRSRMRYQVETDLEIMTAIADTFSTDAFTFGTAGADSNEPIFVIGMPRTGTTLIERILGSHSQVYAAGELNNFARVMMDQVRQTDASRNRSRTDLVRATRELDFARLGTDYVSSTRPLTGSTAHFVDKLPFNFLYVGLIHLALPNARIVNLTRHPMAACYAIYKQLFRDAYPFSYDLDDLAQYYIAYHRLMQHWNTVLPGRIHTLAYENVVNDTESEVRRLLSHCGLEWEDHCLRFYESKQASTTASAAQVRQPIYRSSVDLWRRYEPQLQPLRDRLEEAGIAL